MTNEDYPAPINIAEHLASLSIQLDTIPELQPVVDIITSNPQHVADIYDVYTELTKKLVNLSDEERALIEVSQINLSGDVGSASSVGANNLADEVSTRAIDLVYACSTAYDPKSENYLPALLELISRLKGGHDMKALGKTPSDHDPESLKVIWGHTVITGHEALLHFVTMHYLERFMSKVLSSQGVTIALQKDFFINSMTDIVILEGLKNPEDPIFKLWRTPKDKDGLGWITDDRLESYIGHNS